MMQKMERAMMKKSTVVWTKFPQFSSMASLTTLPSAASSAGRRTALASLKLLPVMRPMGGMMMSLTSEVTILPKAPPMMIPTAISMTLPLRANSLNSCTNLLINFV